MGQSSRPLSRCCSSSSRPRNDPHHRNHVWHKVAVCWTYWHKATCSENSVGRAGLSGSSTRVGKPSKWIDQWTRHAVAAHCRTRAVIASLTSDRSTSGCGQPSRSSAPVWASRRASRDISSCGVLPSMGTPANRENWGSLVCRSGWHKSDSWCTMRELITGSPWRLARSLGKANLAASQGGPR